MRQHGEGSSGDDATTRNLRRPRVNNIGEPPNYARRRAVLLTSALSVAVLAAVMVIVVTAGNDEAIGTPRDSFTVDRPVVTAADPAAIEDIALPIHHGYDSDALYVALYGSIGTASLGVLGERDVAGSVDFAASVAADYEGFGSTVVPTFEIIASVASFEAGDDGDHSNETPASMLLPWVDAADDAGYHVVLDLQSGRQRFPSQITEFETVLLEPNVSVALDPEWRVGSNEVPKGGQVGSVSGAEVNKTVEYLDRLIETHDLPPKMLIVHQFKHEMISDKADIRGTDNVQIVIHMDGFGPLELKRETYFQVTSDLPPGARTGWKNFYDEDEPTPTPQQTMENDPVPMFVSFQ